MSIVKALVDEFELPVTLRDKDWSPSKSGSHASDRLQSQVKSLYFNGDEAREALQNAINEFREIAPRLQTSDERLSHLLDCLGDPIHMTRQKISTLPSLQINDWKTPTGGEPLTESQEVIPFAGDSSPEEHFALAPESSVLSIKHAPEPMVDGFIFPPQAPKTQHQPGVVTADTSFSTTANTSFAATSFTSEQGAGTISTAATSFDRGLEDEPASSPTCRISSPSEREWQRLERNEPEPVRNWKSRSVKGHFEESSSQDQVCRKKRRTSDENDSAGHQIKSELIDVKPEPALPAHEHPIQHQIARFPDVGFEYDEPDLKGTSNPDFAHRFARLRAAQKLEKPVSDIPEDTTFDELESSIAAHLPLEHAFNPTYSNQLEAERARSQDNVVNNSITITPRQVNKGPLIETKLNCPKLE